MVILCGCMITAARGDKSRDRSSTTCPTTALKRREILWVLECASCWKCSTITQSHHKNQMVDSQCHAELLTILCVGRQEHTTMSSEQAEPCDNKIPRFYVFSTHEGKPPINNTPPQTRDIGWRQVCCKLVKQPVCNVSTSRVGPTA